MRVTQNMLATRLLNNMRANLDRLSRAQEQASTAKRINRASDDPAGTSLVLQLLDQRDALKAYQRATDAAQDGLNTAAAPLERVTEILEQAKEVALRGRSDIMADTRAALADEMNQLLEELVTEANTRVGDRYVFGGTQSISAPFTAIRDASGRITGVAANPLGITGAVNAEVAEGVIVQTNLPGDRAFTANTDLFANLIDLRDGLASNDSGRITTGINQVASGLSQINAASGALGAAIQRLDAVRERNRDMLIQVEAWRSRTQDADIAEVATQVQQLTNTYQASLLTGAKALQVSLMDYLR